MAILNRIVDVSEGRLRGTPAGNPEYTIFRGVPYAKAPVGEYRWRGAAAPDKWDGVRDAIEFAPIAIQQYLDETDAKSVNPHAKMYRKEFYPVDFPMDEDSLYLNVWTPTLNPDAKLPVMLWFHGGGFSGGYSYEMEFDGEAFCHRDVILISASYRLGVMGFFAHPELSAKCPNKVSGNYGISDAIQCMKWLRENVASFGGDPENITIFGQSAGGAMVQCLLTSPRAEGLFQRAIVHSAGGINALHDFTLAEMEELGVKICEKLNLTISDLFALPAQEAADLITAAFRELMPGKIGFTPVVDGFLLDMQPGEKIYEGKNHNVDIISGSVSGDGGLFAPVRATTKAEFDAALVRLFGDMADEYKSLFAVETDADVPTAMENLMRASAKLSPLAWAKVRSENGRAIRTFYFDRDLPGDDNGAFHTAELWYVFGTLNRCWRNKEGHLTDGDFSLSRAMTDYWANFAKTGDPNGKGLPVWPEYTKETPLTMMMNEARIEATDMSDDVVSQGVAELLIKKVSRK